VAPNRKNALFAGPDGGAEHWAVIASLIETCKLLDVEPHGYVADIITRIVNGHPIAFHHFIGSSRKSRRPSAGKISPGQAARRGLHPLSPTTCRRYSLIRCAWGVGHRSKRSGSNVPDLGRTGATVDSRPEADCVRHGQFPAIRKTQIRGRPDIIEH
jgi:hypothetical protein